MNVESLEIRSSKKENEKHCCSTCRWNQQEVCVQELTIFQHPLAETHRTQCEAKLVCEVSTSQYCNISERKQLEVRKLKHRFARSRSTFLYRLTHRKHSMDIWICTNCSHQSTCTQLLYQRVELLDLLFSTTSTLLKFGDKFLTSQNHPAIFPFSPFLFSFILNKGTWGVPFNTYIHTIHTDVQAHRHIHHNSATK